MKSTKSPGHYNEYHHEHHDGEETTTEPIHEDEDVESDEDHTHGGHGDELEDNTENASFDERHEEEEEISVEQKLRKLTDDISHDTENRQSFLSLTDLIKTLRPEETHKPVQTDSSYSRSQALGELTMPDIVFHPRQTSKN